MRDPHSLSIGELAARAGVSVRALHHYDAIGLLSPSARTPGGARRYGPADLRRLHHILALRQMGCALPAIREALDAGTLSPAELIERQVHLLEEKARQAQRLGRGLRHLGRLLAQQQDVGPGDWLDVLELMTLYDKHLSEREVEALRAGATRDGGRLEAQWTRLVREVAQAMARQLPVAEAAAGALAWRWVRLVIARTGNDAALAVKLRLLHDTEPRAGEIGGVTPAMMEWIGQAMAHARAALFARHLSARENRAVLGRQLATMAHMHAWPQLVAQMREQMVAGAAPESPTVRELALRWRALWNESLSGSDARLERKLRAAFAAEPDLRLGVGVDDALLAYAAAAAAALEAPCAA
jgi:DNA-binding transcriptional MerR regulator